jgi:hypothetical protein
VGGKTGYTDEARQTLVTIAEKDGMTLICVVMRTERPYQWEDSLALYEYAFDSFQLFNVSENETGYDVMDTASTGSLNTNEAFVDIDKTASIVLPKTAEFSDAVSEIVRENAAGDVVGTLYYTYADREVGKADIVRTGVEIQGFDFDNVNEQDEDVEDEPQEEDKIVISVHMVILIVLGVLLIVVLGIAVKYVIDNFYIIRHNREVKKQRKAQFKRVREKRKRRRRRDKY